MSNSTTTIDLIASSQANKEVTQNALNDAASPATLFGRRATTTAALTWGYYGGTMLVSGVPTQIANGTVSLTSSATNYLYATSAGVVTKTTTVPTGWPGPLAANAIALYQLVVGATAVTSYTDYRTLRGASHKNVLLMAVTDETTSITTGTAKITFRMPYAMRLTEVRASLSTASSSGLPAVNVKKNGVSIFSTTLTIDATEKTSTTAATAAVLSTTALADDDEITVDIDTAGTGAKGLKIALIGA